ENFESAFISLVCELAFEHVEPYLLNRMRVVVGVYEDELRSRIYKSSDQPGQGDPIYLHPTARDPGAPLQVFYAGFSLLRLLGSVQNAVYRTHNHLHLFTSRRVEEVYPAHLLVTALQL